MPAFQDRAKQATSEEIPEFKMTGPFGGYQSEVPRDLIEQLGFANVTNMVQRLGAIAVRPGRTTLELMPDPQEAIIGIADFFTEDELRIQTIMTATRLLQYIAGSFTEVAAVTPYSGTDDDFWTWTVVNNQLLYSNNVDPVYTWNGVDATTDVVSTDAVAAKFLMELNTHLLVANTLESGNRFSQRVRWTAAGDPTDWTGFNAGVTDILNALGPITGLAKLYQTGYAFHQWGVTQIIPTGIGLAPFRFVPMTSKARGNICPYSVATSGEELAAYVGKDNIYVFNGTSSDPIGDFPVAESRSRAGARTAIFADIFVGDNEHTLGYISENVNGRNFSAYWLVIPNVAVWVFNFDERNWQRFTYDAWITAIGTFYTAAVIRIMDLVGLISEQNWTPDTLNTANPFDAMLLGMEDGTPALVDFTTYSEEPWSVSGCHVFGDTRHSKSVKKFRLCVVDNGETTFNVTVTNQNDQSETQSVTLGTGTGKVISRVLAFNISGIRIAWTVSGEAGQSSTFSEFAPMFVMGGEQRGGDVDQ